MKEKPSRDLLKRHQKAMTLVKHLNEDDRILLLSYVIAPTIGIRAAESAQHQAMSATR